MYKMLLSIMKGRYSWGKGANGTCNPSLLSLGESVSSYKKYFIFIPAPFQRLGLFNTWPRITVTYLTPE